MMSTVKMAGGVGAAAVVAALVLAQKFETAPPAQNPARASVAARPAANIAPTRVAATPTAPAPVRASGGAVTLRATRNGHFFAPVEINGRVAEMLVDTGASYVSLSAEDAEAFGVFADASAGHALMQTANGVVKVGRARIREVRLDTVMARDVEAVIAPPGAQRGSLLGMSFLKKLSSFQASEGELTLRP